MQITRLRLNQYRNYTALDLAPHRGINVLVGDNAQGKTNAIEAVFLCAFGRSHRTSRDGELIRAGQPGGYVGVDLRSDQGVARQIGVKLRAGERKRLLIDGQPAGRLGELMGVLNVVMFAPEDLALVKGGPVERRRFMDMELSQCRPAYFYGLQQYNSALRQRNALLKGPPGTVQPEMLEIWDVQLSALGAQIMEARWAFVERLYAIAQGLHSRLSGGKETLGLAYAPNVAYGPGQDVEGLLLQALTQSAREDIRGGFTAAGPHRDDLAVYIGEGPAHLWLPGPAAHGGPVHQAVGAGPFAGGDRRDPGAAPGRRIKRAGPFQATVFDGKRSRLPVFPYLYGFGGGPGFRPGGGRGVPLPGRRPGGRRIFAIGTACQERKRKG